MHGACQPAVPGVAGILGCQIRRDGFIYALDVVIEELGLALAKQCDEEVALKLTSLIENAALTQKWKCGSMIEPAIPDVGYWEAEGTWEPRLFVSAKAFGCIRTIRSPVRRPAEPARARCFGGSPPAALASWHTGALTNLEVVALALAGWHCH